jgi:CMP-N-acetylneuraminic acid synthetase
MYFNFSSIKFLQPFGADGLIPAQPQGSLRRERDVFYEDNGALYVSRLEAITAESFLGQRLGHLVMLPEDSVQIDGPFERWMVERVLSERNLAHADRPA